MNQFRVPRTNIRKRVMFFPTRTSSKKLYPKCFSYSSFWVKGNQTYWLLHWFLAKKSLFNAKDFIAHRFTMNRIAFNPGTSFISGLWHCDFFWTLADTPSGVSIFFCPEIKVSECSQNDPKPSCGHILGVWSPVAFSIFSSFMGNAYVWQQTTFFQAIWIWLSFFCLCIIWYW